LSHQGTLPGGLRSKRRARSILEQLEREKSSNRNAQPWHLAKAKSCIARSSIRLTAAASSVGLSVSIHDDDPH